MPRIPAQVDALLPVQVPSTEFEHQQERERRAILRRLRTVRIDIGKEMAVLKHFQRLVARRPHMPHRDLLHIIATVEAVKEVVRTHHVTITNCQRQLQVDSLLAKQKGMVAILDWRTTINAWTVECPRRAFDRPRPINSFPRYNQSYAYEPLIILTQP